MKSVRTLTHTIHTHLRCLLTHLRWQPGKAICFFFHPLQRTMNLCLLSPRVPSHQTVNLYQITKELNMFLTIHDLMPLIFSSPLTAAISLCFTLLKLFSSKHTHAPKEEPGDKHAVKSVWICTHLSAAPKFVGLNLTREKFYLQRFRSNLVK